MVFRGQVIEENIMLWADPEDLSELLHVFKYVDTANRCFTLSRLEQAGQHRNGCGFTSSIVTQKSKYLAIIHVHIGVVHSNLLSKLLSQPCDAQALTSFLLSLELVVNLFKVMLIVLDQIFFLILFINCPPLFAFATEVPRFGDTVLTGHDLIHVHTQQRVKDYVKKHDGKAVQEGIFLVDYVDRIPSGTSTRAQIEPKYLFDALVHCHIWQNTKGVLNRARSGTVP